MYVYKERFGMTEMIQQSDSKSEQPVLGFIGIGLMGNPMVGRLLDAGFDVRVWGRSVEKLKGVADAGASVCSSVMSLVKDVDILMLCVSDTEAVGAVVFGDNGVVAACQQLDMPRLKTLVDFSSIDPEATRNFAGQLSGIGIEWVDSPVSGGVAGAEKGSLAIMCGGKEEVIEDLLPVLSTLSQRVTRMGDVGCGQVTKICNQMIVSCNVLVMAEVMALAEKAGVEGGKIPQALKGGFADSIPLQLTGPRMAEKDFEEVKWHVKTLLKDLDMANDLAKTLLSSVPMAGLGAELMRQHGSKGFMDQDPATLVSMYQK